MQKLCCMRLNTAGVVIGWLGVVGSVIMIIALSVALAHADMIAKDMETSDDIKSARFLVVALCSIYLATSLINLLSSGMLIVGTMKERHLMLLPWLINSALALVSSSAYHLGVLISAFTSPLNSTAIPLVFITGIVLALQIYIYCGIYSLYKQIQGTRDLQRPLNQPQPANPNYNIYTKM